MAQFDPDEGVAVSGRAVLAAIEGIPDPFEDEALAILSGAGIGEPDPAEWYARGDWLDALAEVHDRIGAATLTEIGKAVPRTAEWPADPGSLPEGLASIDDAYRRNHRGVETEGYDTERVSERAVVVRSRTPYPPPFEEGVVRATAAAFATEGVPTVSGGGDGPRGDGGEGPAFEVSW